MTPETRPDVEFYVRRFIRHTRTVHHCAACRKDIPVGSPAVRQVAKVTGEFCSEYLHDPYGECQTDQYWEAIS